MRILPVHEAKDKLSALLQAVEQGEEVVITRHGKHIARIVREPNDQSAQATVEAQRQDILRELRELHARVSPAVAGVSDWKSLRDAGRKY